jgi:hypothetical protein
MLGVTAAAVCAQTGCPPAFGGQQPSGSSIGGQIDVQTTTTTRNKDRNVVYRALRGPDNKYPEDPALGLWAKDPTATYTPQEHIRAGVDHGSLDTQYISTSREKQAVLDIYGKDPDKVIVEIDLDKVAGLKLDFNDPETRALFLNDPQVIAAAIRDKEVLIVGYVPPEAITVVPH